MQNLRELREISGLSQFAVAARAGVSRVRLSLHECGELELSAEETQRVRQVVLGAMRAQAAKLNTVLARATVASTP